MRISIINIRRSWPSYLYNGNSHTGKTVSLYWDGTLFLSSFRTIVGGILLNDVSNIDIRRQNAIPRSALLDSWGKGETMGAAEGRGLLHRLRYMEYLTLLQVNWLRLWGLVQSYSIWRFKKIKKRRSDELWRIYNNGVFGVLNISRMVINETAIELPYHNVEVTAVNLKHIWNKLHLQALRTVPYKDAILTHRLFGAKP